MATVVIMNNDWMGHGDDELGRRILATFLRKLPSMPGVEAVVLYNAGVRLATKDSHVAVELGLLQEQGVDILVCGTCAKHFGLADSMLCDRISNMDEIMATIFGAGKVITL